MALQLKQQVKLSQQLVMTPQLQQAIKLLQLSRLELVGMVQKELQENPVLEEVGEADDDRGSDADPTPAASHSKARMRLDMYTISLSCQILLNIVAAPTLMVRPLTWKQSLL